MKRTTLVAVMLCLFVFSCNKKKQVTAKFVEIEIVRDTNNNIIMAK
jgi:hypothetical protein